MTTEELCFVRAINADPDDDTARLVYADWLEENGEDERAEFIRVQCELARMPTECDRTFCDGQLVVCDDCKRWKRLRRRQRELLDAHRGNWFVLPGLQRPWSNGRDDVVWLTGGGSGYTMYLGGRVHRGFVESVTCTAEDWRAHADSLYWRPGLAVDCPECVVDPPIGWYHKNGCPVCSRTGRVERPCPPTAQPIRKVTLTTTPGWRIAPALPGVPPLIWRLARGPENDAATIRWLGQKWPGVEFELPPGGCPVPEEFTPVAIRESMRRLGVFRQYPAPSDATAPPDRGVEGDVRNAPEIT